MSGCMVSQLAKIGFWFMTSRSHVPNGQQQHLVRVGKTFPVVAQPMSRRRKAENKAYIPQPAGAGSWLKLVFGS